MAIEASMQTVLASAEGCKEHASFTCMVRMSNLPRNSLTETSRSKTVRYMSADVPAQSTEQKSEESVGH